jgi:hypothetical protein
MRRPQSSRDYERLLRHETTAEKYWETLRRDARANAERVAGRSRQKART